MGQKLEQVAKPEPFAPGRLLLFSCAFFVDCKVSAPEAGAGMFAFVQPWIHQHQGREAWIDLQLLPDPVRIFSTIAFPLLYMVLEVSVANSCVDLWMIEVLVCYLSQGKLLGHALPQVFGRLCEIGHQQFQAAHGLCLTRHHHPRVDGLCKPIGLKRRSG